MNAKSTEGQQATTQDHLNCDQRHRLNRQAERQLQGGMLSLLLYCMSVLSTTPIGSALYPLIVSILFALLSLKKGPQYRQLFVSMALLLGGIGAIMLALSEPTKWLPFQFFIFALYLSLPPRFALRASSASVVIVALSGLIYGGQSGDTIYSVIGSSNWITGIAVAMLTVMLMWILFRRLENLEKSCLDAQRTDPMTGIANRETLIDELENAIAMNERYGLKSSALLMRIDASPIDGKSGPVPERDFASCVRKWVAIWSSRIRQTDRLCRLDHNTFVLVLNGSSEQQAETLAKDLQVASSAYELDCAVSFELSVRTKECDHSHTPEIWLGILDGV